MAIAVHASEPRFLFFWNHKVASRSLLNALEKSFPRLRVYPQPSFRPPAQDQDWPRFLLVRDPWARAASCFRNKCRDALEALERNGGLEPCQHHLLRELGAWPCRSVAGARRLAELDFAEFVELLPGVRDGNSHFRLQIDVLQDASAITSRVSWAGRAARTLLHLGRTHYLTPRLFKTRPTVAADQATLAEGQRQSVRWLRLEDLPEVWREVEHTLGRTIPLPWHARTAKGDDWRALYDATLEARVAELYRPDLEMFGYGAPEPR
ncbi:MAG: hypothetical protein IID07_00495 [Gemmatimonadetes bacterium]|nr:hypothetical protein [Gemmatimonadota bacterium]